jgi:hypothetical protein
VVVELKLPSANTAGDTSRGGQLVPWNSNSSISQILRSTALLKKKVQMHLVAVEEAFISRPNSDAD